MKPGDWVVLVGGRDDELPAQLACRRTAQLGTITGDEATLVHDKGTQWEYEFGPYPLSRIVRATPATVPGRLSPPRGQA